MTQNPSPNSFPAQDPTASDRIERFESDVAALDVPVPAANREIWTLWGGVALVVIGIVVVFAGYWGASGTANVADQLPYMLSGGALGLALVVIGAVLVGRYSMARLFRFWLALLVAENRAQTDRIVEAIEGATSEGSAR